MNKLLDNYRDFIKNDFIPNKSRFNEFVNGQSPETLFITCADSRINANDITGTKPGELFVIRNAGNLVPTLSEAAGTTEGLTIEYAVTQLNVKQIIVCGHAHCGAMGAILGYKGLPTELTMIRSGLEGKLSITKKLDNYKSETATEEIDRLIEINVNEQLSNLASYPFIKERLEKGEIALYGWVYDFTTGNLKYKSLNDGSYKQELCTGN